MEIEYNQYLQKGKLNAFHTIKNQILWCYKR